MCKQFRYYFFFSFFQTHYGMGICFFCVTLCGVCMSGRVCKSVFARVSLNYFYASLVRLRAAKLYCLSVDFGYINLFLLCILLLHICSLSQHTFTSVTLTLQCSAFCTSHNSREDNVFLFISVK